MHITVTHIRLRSIWQYFRLIGYAMPIMRQTRSEPGFLRLRSRGIGLNHYTLTAWATDGDLKRFARSGAHLTAMQQSRSVAREISTFTYEGDTFPTWPAAIARLEEEGKRLEFR